MGRRRRIIHAAGLAHIGDDVRLAREIAIAAIELAEQVGADPHATARLREIAEHLGQP